MSLIADHENSIIENEGIKIVKISEPPVTQIHEYKAHEVVSLEPQNEITNDERKNIDKSIEQK